MIHWENTQAQTAAILINAFYILFTCEKGESFPKKQDKDSQ